MKKTIPFIALFLIASFYSIAQSPEGKDKMNRMFAKSVKYPMEARHENKTGFVTLSISIDENGYPVGEPSVYSSIPILSEEVLRTYSEVRDAWDPSFLDGKKVGEDYLMTFQFKIQNGKELVNNPLSEYKTPKEVDPLEELNKAIKKNPYSSDLYKKRGEYYAMINKMWLSKLDYNQSDFLKKNEITNIVIVGYGTTNAPKAL